MKIIVSRLRKLEDRFGAGDGKPRILFVVCHAGSQHDTDWQIDILEKHGLLPSEPIGLVCLAGMPRGLNERQAESYLRAKGTSFKESAASSGRPEGEASSA